MMMTEEVWNDIPGFEGFYSASSIGRIRSEDRVISTYSQKARRSTVQRRKGVVLATCITPAGYESVTLSLEGYATTKRVNILVCEAFHGKKKNGMQVRHLDGNKLNNRQENLKWGTAKENQKDRVRHGTDIRGEDVVTSKLTVPDVIEVLESRTYSEYVGKPISRTQYYRIKKGESWAHIIRDSE